MSNILPTPIARLVPRGGAAVLLLLATWLSHATPPPDAATALGLQANEDEQNPASVAAETPEKPVAKKSNAQILEELLAESPEEIDASQQVTCIARREVKRFEILSAELLLVHGSKGRRWINQFHHRCNGLRRNQALVIETRGSGGARYCALDTVYGRDRSAFGMDFGSARCHFAKFQPVTVEQAQMLKLAAKNGAFR